MTTNYYINSYLIPILSYPVVNIQWENSTNSTVEMLITGSFSEEISALLVNGGEITIGIVTETVSIYVTGTIYQIVNRENSSKLAIENITSYSVGEPTSFVLGPTTSTLGDIVLFNSETGNLISDSGLSISDLATSSEGVTNGNSHDHVGGDGAQLDHINLSNKGTNTHATIDSHIASIDNPHSVTASQTGAVAHSTATAEHDFLLGAASPFGSWVKHTLAETKTALGLGSAAYTASTDYAVAAKGVTNGDSHDHNGGDGGQIAHSSLGSITATDHHSNANDPTSDQKAALAGTSGTTPSISNKFVDNADTRMTNSRTPTSHASSHISTGGDAIAGAVAGGASGLMTGSDKTKLDGIASGAVSDHGALSGNSDDDHTQYALLAGRAGGQTIYGDTASGGNLTLRSTAHATKGKILIDDSQFQIGSGYFVGLGNAHYMGPVGFNRFPDTGTIQNSDYGAFQCHNHDGIFEFQIYSALGAMISQISINTVGYIGCGGITASVGLELPNSATSGEGLAYAWGTHSSRRWKENIIPIDNALEKILALRGVEFDWKEDSGGLHDIGLIAEEVGDIVPEVVKYEENGIDARSIDYGKLVGLLIAGIQEQQKQIDLLKDQISKIGGN